MARQIVIEFLGKDKSLGSTAASADRKTSKLGDTLKKVGKVGALALAAGAVVAGKALFDMAKAAAEDAKSAELLATTLRNTAGATDKQIASVEDWISAQGRALGVADDELRPALQRLAEATGSVSKAQDLASVAMDISAGTGKSLKTVSEALAKAQMGNVGALSRYGIRTRDAKGEMMSFEEVVKSASKTFKGQASTAANTYEGKMARLRLIFDETKESIGAKLLPIITKLADWFLREGLPAVEKFGGWLSDKFGPILSAVGDWISDLSEKFGGAEGATSKMKGALEDARPFFELVGKVASKVLGPALKWLAEHVVAHLGRQFELLAKGLGVVGRAGIWLWNNALAPTFRFIAKGVADVMRGWADMLRVLAKVPGFGWAGRAADALDRAAGKADKFADGIKSIPDEKRVEVRVSTPNLRAVSRDLDWLARSRESRLTITRAYAAAGRETGGGLQQRAHGGPVLRGRPYLVGEREPELFVPNQSGRILNQRQMRAAGVADSDGTVARFEIPLTLEGREVQRALLTLKRRNGGLELGLA